MSRRKIPAKLPGFDMRLVQIAYITWPPRDFAPSDFASCHAMMSFNLVQVLIRGHFRLRVWTSDRGKDATGLT